MGTYQSILKPNVYLTVEEVADHLGIRPSKINPGGVDEAKATGSVRIVNNVFEPGDVVEVGGVNFEQGVDWTAGLDEAASAEALRAAIAMALPTVVVPTINPDDTQQILLEAVEQGVLGNNVTLSVVDGLTTNFEVSGATLLGGVDDVPFDEEIAITRRRIERFMNVATDKAETEIETNILCKDMTEFLDGTNSNVIVPSHWPILSVTNLFIDYNRQFGDETRVDELNYFLRGTPDRRDPQNRVVGSDIVLRDDDKLTIVGRIFAGSILGSIKLDYKTGWALDASDVPSDLNHATVQLVEYYYFQRENRDLSVQSKGVKGETFSRLTNGIPDEIFQVLDKYKNFNFGFSTNIQANTFEAES